LPFACGLSRYILGVMFGAVALAIIAHPVRAFIAAKTQNLGETLFQRFLSCCRNTSVFQRRACCSMFGVSPNLAPVAAALARKAVAASAKKAGFMLRQDRCLNTERFLVASIERLRGTAWAWAADRTWRIDILVVFERWANVGDRRCCPSLICLALSLAVNA
jgi:hypothetical protein